MQRIDVQFCAHSVTPTASCQQTHSSSLSGGPDHKCVAFHRNSVNYSLAMIKSTIITDIRNNLQGEGVVQGQSYWTMTVSQYRENTDVQHRDRWAAQTIGGFVSGGWIPPHPLLIPETVNWLPLDWSCADKQKALLCKRTDKCQRQRCQFVPVSLERRHSVPGVSSSASILLWLSGSRAIRRDPSHAMCNGHCRRTQKGTRYGNNKCA